MRRTGRSQLKFRKAGCHAGISPHTPSQQQPNFMKGTDKDICGSWHCCESEQGHNATGVNEEESSWYALHIIQAKVHDSIDLCVMLLFLKLLLITHILRREAKVWVSLSCSWWSYGISSWVTWCTSLEMQLGKNDSQTAFSSISTYFLTTYSPPCSLFHWRSLQVKLSIFRRFKEQKT